MGARVLDGRAVAERIEAEVRAGVERLRAATGVTPGLDVVLVGDDPASVVYTRRKVRACRRAGIRGRLHRLPAGASQDEVAALIDRLNADPATHGILLQWPVPPHLDFDALIERLDPAKDVDGLHAENLGRLLAGRPGLVTCTPRAVLELLDHHGIAVAGRRCVVLGRSRIVGRPLAALLLARDATVTVCHSRTRDLVRHTREAEVLVVAVNRAELIGAAHVAPGTVVVDVGVHRRPDGGLVGDVRADEVAAVAAAYTPVPGGVGPVTVAVLLRNTLEAAERLCAGAVARR